MVIYYYSATPHVAERYNTFAIFICLTYGRSVNSGGCLFRGVREVARLALFTRHIQILCYKYLRSMNNI